MFEFGEGPMTRSSIRGTKSEAFSTPMKYITRAALHRASESEETKADVLEGLSKASKQKEDDCSKLAQSSSSSVFSEQERNLSTLSDDEGFGSPTILPSIPSILARPHHQLSQVVFVYFLATLVALHFTPVSKSVSGCSFGLQPSSVAWSLRACCHLIVSMHRRGACGTTEVTPPSPGLRTRR